MSGPGSEEEGEIEWWRNWTLRVPDGTTLERLNQQYVAAFLNSDVEWHRKPLADEFICIESDGSPIHKQKFLSNVPKGPDVADYKLDQVDGYTAVVQRPAFGVDGSKGMSRYIDVYVKDREEWKTVSAQITRSSSSGPPGPYKRPK